MGVNSLDCVYALYPTKESTGNNIAEERIIGGGIYSNQICRNQRTNIKSNLDAIQILFGFLPFTRYRLDKLVYPE